jgi:predicted RNase H-like nuclease (RuvC/YqgF family)
LTLAQTTIPTASDLATLNPVVAVVFLGVVALGITLFYFGKPLQERLRGKKDDPPKAADPTATAPIAAVMPSAPAALDRAAEMTDRFISDLREQIGALRGEVDEQEREIKQLRTENDRLRDEAWRRSR